MASPTFIIPAVSNGNNKRQVDREIAGAASRKRERERERERRFDELIYIPLRGLIDRIYIPAWRMPACVSLGCGFEET